MRNLLLIGLGGALGSVARYLTGGFVHRILDRADFPFGTVTINVAGCFVIGALGGLVESRQMFGPEARLFLFIGVLGGFTTFSTFGYETLALAQEGETMAAAANVFLQVTLGLLAVWLGNVITRFV